MITFLIRADADGKMGTGHVMRMMGIAQYWQELGLKITFVSRCESQALRQLVSDSGFRLIDVENSPGDEVAIDALIEEARRTIAEESSFMPWVVMDGYQFTSAHQKIVKDAGCPLMFVDDFGHASHYFADVVLNQNLSADESLYSSRESYADLLLGVEYAVLRREFRGLSGWKRSVLPVAGKLLITLGGVDSENVTEKIIRSLRLVSAPDIEARVIVGPANPHLDRIKVAAGSAGIPCIVVTQANMPEEFKWADMAILAGGTTCLEAGFMGLPALTVILADNQVEVAAKLAEQGVTVNLGWHHGLSEASLAGKIEAFVKDTDLRLRCSCEGQRLIDGKGVERVTRRIMAHSIRLRLAAATDCELIWKWANDPDVRSVSFNTDQIPLEDHVKWFNNRLNRDDVRFYLAVTDRGVPLGYARFEPDTGSTVVSVLLDPTFRGRGLGSVLIDEACRQFSRDTSLSTVKAYIKQDNQSSRRAFDRAGFREVGLTEIKGHKAVEMKRTAVH